MERGRVVRSLHRVDEAAQHVPRVVADLRRHLEVADVAHTRGVNLGAERAQEMCLPRAGLAEDEQRAAVAALDLLGRAGANDLAMEHLADLAVDRFDVERIAGVDLRTMGNRCEHLRAIGATEGERARIEAQDRLPLEHRAQVAACLALDVGGPSREDLVHDSREHPLVVAKRRCVSCVLLDLSHQVEAAPFVQRTEAERPRVVAVRAEKALDVARRRGAVGEGLVLGQRREVLAGRHAHEVRDARQLLGIDPSVRLDRLVGDAQAIVEQGELDQHGQRGAGAIEPGLQRGRGAGAHRLA